MSNYDFQQAYSYDDILILPFYSALESRGQSELKTSLGGIDLATPILSSPMDTVTEENMAVFMWENGGMGVIHRYMPVNQQYASVKWVKNMGARVGAAIGVNGDAKERSEALLEAGADMLVLDIAHGHMSQAIQLVGELKSSFPSAVVMSGNIATIEAANDYAEVGADILRIGIGAGSACSTRLVAGVGYPQFSAVVDICHFIETYYPEISCVADGGIKNSGDIVKALAAGADAVMLGGLLAPFRVAAGDVVYVETSDESPVNDVFPTFQSNTKDVASLYKGTSYVQKKIPQIRAMKQFRGMASDAALSARGKDDYVIEGEGFMVPVRGDHQEFMKNLIEGIRTGLSYCGAKNLDELRYKARFVIVTANGYNEGVPHFQI